MNTFIKFITNKFTLIGILLIFLFIGLVNSSQYNIEKTRKCIVKEKMPMNDKYGTLVLVLQEERGIVFDVKVSPSTFYKATRNGVMYFELSEQDITKLEKYNFYQLGKTIICIIGIIFIFIGLVASDIIKD